MIPSALPVLLASCLSQMSFPAVSGLSAVPDPATPVPGVHARLLISWTHYTGFDFYMMVSGPSPVVKYSLTAPITPANWGAATSAPALIAGADSDSIVIANLPGGTPVHLSVILVGTRMDPRNGATEGVMTQVPATSILVTTPADHLAPAAIQDLQGVLSADRLSVQFAFAATADDPGETVLPAQSYVAAFSNRAITPQNAGGLPKLPVPGAAPGVPGAPELRTVPAPGGDGEFWAVLFSRDAAGNYSEASNVAYFAGTPAPPPPPGPGGSGSGASACAAAAGDDENGASGAGALVGLFAATAFLRSRRPPPPSRT